VTLTDRILEVPASNLTPKTGYPQFFLRLSSARCNCLYTIFSWQTTTVCFDSLSNVLFTVYRDTRAVIICLTETTCSIYIYIYIYKWINIDSIGVHEANEVEIIVYMQQHIIC